MPKVSVLIPIFNVEKYLRQCLDSAVNQTLKDIEIICINDGSTDSSLEILQEYAKVYNSIKIINKQNTGYGHSMNCGLKLAKGEYIGIIESDDFADKNMFEVLYNKAKSFEAEVVKSSWFRQFGDNAIFTKLSNLPYDQVFVPRLEQPTIFFPPIAIWSAIYKREFLLNNDIYFNETPGASYQDVSFVFKVWSCTARALLIEEGFLHYRMDNPNSSVKSKEKAYCIFNEFKEIKRFLKNRPDIYNICRYIMEPVKFKHYISNYKRIDNVFKFDFLRKMYEEFQNDYESKNLNRNYWKEDMWQDVQLLLRNKNMFFRNKYEELQSAKFQLIGFLSTIKNFRKIYIYGAGIIASKLILNLFQRNIKVNGILVSNLKDNPKMLMDIPINTLENINIDKENDVILIAIKEEDQSAVFCKLKMLDFRNIILITNDIRKA